MTNQRVTLISAILFLFSILLGSCAKKENSISQDLDGKWKVISFDDNVNQTKITKTDTNTWPQFNNGENTISFHASNSCDGDVFGRNVTNSFSGKFERVSDSILIKELIWTEIGEPIWGQLFHSIESSETFEILGDKLIIYYNHKSNSITLLKLDN
jgi:hypothetical protein